MEVDEQDSPLLSVFLTDPISAEVWDPSDGFTCERRGNMLLIRKTLLSLWTP